MPRKKKAEVLPEVSADKTTKQITKPIVTLDKKVVSNLILHNDIKQLTAEQKVDFVLTLCQNLGLNPALAPFSVLELQGREIIYANKSCTEQLRKIYGVSITSSKSDIISMEDGAMLYRTVVTLQDQTGRTDTGVGIVPLKGYNNKSLSADVLANALMKADTKAKRRGTLSICGLGFLDESELDTLPNAKPIEVVLEKDAIPQPQVSEPEDNPDTLFDHKGDINQDKQNPPEITDVGAKLASIKNFRDLQSYWKTLSKPVQADKNIKAMFTARKADLAEDFYHATIKAVQKAKHKAELENILSETVHVAIWLPDSVVNELRELINEKIKDL